LAWQYLLVRTGLEGLEGLAVPSGLEGLAVPSGLEGLANA